MLKPLHYLGNKGIARCCLGERSQSAHTLGLDWLKACNWLLSDVIRRRAAKAEG